VLGLGLGRFRARDEAARSAGDDLKARLSLRLGLTPQDSIAAMEIACADPSCPAEIETVILVMRQGQKTQAVKILKRIAEIDDDDIDGAIAQAGIVASGRDTRPPLSASF